MKRYASEDESKTLDIPFKLSPLQEEKLLIFFKYYLELTAFTIVVSTRRSHVLVSPPQSFVTCAQHQIYTVDMCQLVAA